MPRPKLSERDLRSHRITASVNSAEWWIIQDRARQARMSVPEFIRQRVVRDRLQIESPRQLDARTFREVQRLGVNVNQIARAMNRGSKPPQNLPPVLQRLIFLLKKLLPEEPD